MSNLQQGGVTDRALISHAKLVVQSIEFKHESVETFLQQKIILLSEKLMAKKKLGHYIIQIEADIQRAIEKASNARLWQDNQDQIIRAFNHLTMLGSIEKHQISSILITPIRIIKGYEDYCEHIEQAPNLNIIDEILRTSFIAGPERAEKLYHLYLKDTRRFDPIEIKRSKTTQSRYVKNRLKWYQPEESLLQFFSSTFFRFFSQSVTPAVKHPVKTTLNKESVFQFVK